MSAAARAIPNWSWSALRFRKRLANPAARRAFVLVLEFFACGSRAAGRATLIHDRDLDPRGCKRIGNDRAGDPGTHHQYIRRDVPGEPRESHTRRRAALPYRMAA